MDKKFFYDQALASGVSDSSIEKILQKILGCSREHLFLLSDIPASKLYEFQKYLYEFQKGIPEAYILWEQEFYWRKFFCDSSTLIPRKETEQLVDNFKNICLINANMNESSYIDIGTGTSCILTTMLLELYPLSFSEIYWVDISEDVLQLSQKNITFHWLSETQLMKSSLLDIFLSDDTIKLSKNLYISANLPYVRLWDTENMGCDVVYYEPANALYWWDSTWFELYESMLKQCFLLKKIKDIHNIHLCIEIWYDQYGLSKRIFSELWLQFEYFQDIHKIPRIVYITGF